MASIRLAIGQRRLVETIFGHQQHATATLVWPLLDATHHGAPGVFLERPVKERGREKKLRALRLRGQRLRSAFRSLRINVAGEFKRPADECWTPHNNLLFSP